VSEAEPRNRKGGRRRRRKRKTRQVVGPVPPHDSRRKGDVKSF
jgi:hypothetical protein